MVTNNAINSNTNQFLKIASNLSDVGSVSTSRTNLGLGTADSPTFRGVQLSNASSNYVQLNVPTSGLSNQTYVLPSNFPSGSNQYLISDTSGNTSWSSTLTATIDLVTTVNASGASTVNFTGLNTTYYMYWLTVGNLQMSTGGTQMNLRTSLDNGSTFQTTAYYYSRFSYDNTPASSVGGGNNQGSFVLSGGYTMANGTNQLQEFDIYMWGCGNTGRRPYFSSNAVMDNGARPCCVILGGFWDNGAIGANTVNAVQLIPSAGTMTGTFKLYGFKA